MEDFFQGVIVVFVIIALVVVLFLGYIGIIPGLSKILGADKPKDLGITYTQEDYSTGHSKGGIELGELPTGTSYAYSIVQEGSHEINQPFTNSEITAIANNRKWIYWPIYNVQVKFNADGSMETSGMVKFEAGYKYLQAIGVSTADIDAAITKFKIPKINFPYYLKLKPTVQNNQVSLSFDKVELARLPVPSSIVSQYTPNVINFLESGLSRSPSVRVKSLTIEEGKVNFSGSLPNKESTLNIE